MKLSVVVFLKHMVEERKSSSYSSKQSCDQGSGCLPPLCILCAGAGVQSALVKTRSVRGTRIRQITTQIILTVARVTR